MKNIAFIYSGAPVNLNSLENNRNAIYTLFNNSLLWEEPVNKELLSLNQFEKDLKQYEDEEINNLFFFYTGHGVRKGQKRDELHVVLKEDGTWNIQELINEVFEVFRNFKFLPKRISIVLDACYSGLVIEDTKSFTGSLEILTATASMQKATEENPNSTLSLFTDAFCKAVEKLSKGSREVTLENVSKLIERSDYSKESGYSYPKTKNGMMTIVEHSQYDLLINITNDLKKHLNNDEQILEVYTKRLFEFKSITMPSSFDDIVKYLFEDYREILIVMLHKFDDTKLNTHIDGLLDLQRKNRSDIPNFSSMKLNMFKERTNLLVVCKSAGKDNSAVMVQIQEYRNDKPYNSLTPFIVNLNKEDGIKTFIDAIEQRIVSNGWARDEVLIEVFLPYEMIGKDISLWKSSNNKCLKPIIIKRLFTRIEVVRKEKNIKKEWDNVWGFYREQASLLLGQVMTKQINYRKFKKKPYVRLSQSLCMSTYKELIEESASIVLLPLVSTNIDSMDEICKELSKIPLKDLIKESYEKFDEEEVPYLLIWDNPNRLPFKRTETKEHEHKSVIGA